MALVNWQSHLSRSARSAISIEYSHLHIPHDPTKFANGVEVANIILGSGYVANIIWDSNKEKYIAALLPKDANYIIVVRKTDSIDKLIEIVSEWIEDYA